LQASRYSAHQDSEDPSDELPSVGPGGRWPIKNDDPKVNELLRCNIGRLITGSSFVFKNHSITHITGQIVAGISYEVTGTYEVADGVIKNCIVSLWVREWLPEPSKVIVHATCDDGSEYQSI